MYREKCGEFFGGQAGKCGVVMKRCIVVSDSFKGTLSSREICRIAKRSIARFFPECEVISLPAADGGEGTTDCFLEALGGTKVTVGGIRNLFGEEIEAFYGRIDDTTAVIEMAAAAGLPMAGNRKNPEITTTYGIGQLILHAVREGATQIILGLGGSATNDGGCGCAAALGVRFYDKDGNSFIPVGGTLERIADIDVTAAGEQLKNITIHVMCDIDNPLHGEQGAAYIFGPQKGADEAMVKRLDKGLKLLDAVIEKSLGRSVAVLPGAGAAGAFGAGCVAFLDAELKSGIEIVLDTVGFDSLLLGSDLVITGEGRLDGQSLRGKVVCGVAARASKKQVPVLVFTGSVSDDADAVYEMGVTAVFTTNRQGLPFEELKERSGRDYERTLEDALRLIGGRKMAP